MQITTLLLGIFCLVIHLINAETTTPSQTSTAASQIPAWNSKPTHYFKLSEEELKDPHKKYQPWITKPFILSHPDCLLKNALEGLTIDEIRELFSVLIEVYSDSTMLHLEGVHESLEVIRHYAKVAEKQTEWHRFTEYQAQPTIAVTLDDGCKWAGIAESYHPVHIPKLRESIGAENMIRKLSSLDKLVCKVGGKFGLSEAFQKYEL